ncbi:flagellar hook-length control protein FliK [Roseivivax sp. CAU 1753]
MENPMPAPTIPSRTTPVYSLEVAASDGEQIDRNGKGLSGTGDHPLFSDEYVVLKDVTQDSQEGDHLIPKTPEIQSKLGNELHGAVDITEESVVATRRKYGDQNTHNILVQAFSKHEKPPSSDHSSAPNVYPHNPVHQPVNLDAGCNSLRHNSVDMPSNSRKIVDVADTKPKKENLPIDTSTGKPQSITALEEDKGTVQNGSATFCQNIISHETGTEHQKITGRLGQVKISALNVNQWMLAEQTIGIVGKPDVNESGHERIQYIGKNISTAAAILRPFKQIETLHVDEKNIVENRGNLPSNSKTQFEINESVGAFISTYTSNNSPIDVIPISEEERLLPPAISTVVEFSEIDTSNHKLHIALEQVLVARSPATEVVNSPSLRSIVSDKRAETVRGCDPIKVEDAQSFEVSHRLPHVDRSQHPEVANPSVEIAAQRSNPAFALVSSNVQNRFSPANFVEFSVVNSREEPKLITGAYDSKNQDAQIREAGDDFFRRKSAGESEQPTIKIASSKYRAVGELGDVRDERASEIDRKEYDHPVKKNGLPVASTYRYIEDTDFSTASRNFGKMRELAGIEVQKTILRDSNPKVNSHQNDEVPIPNASDSIEELPHEQFAVTSKVEKHRTSNATPSPIALLTHLPQMQTPSRYTLQHQGTSKNQMQPLQPRHLPEQTHQVPQSQTVARQPHVHQSPSKQQTGVQGIHQHDAPIIPEYQSADADVYAPVQNQANRLSHDVFQTNQVKHVEQERANFSSVPLKAISAAMDAQPFREDAADVPLSIRHDSIAVTQLHRSGTALHHPAQVPVIQQVVDAIRTEQAGVIDLRLHPEELGRLRIQITPGEAGMVVQILGDRMETIDLLKRHGPALERAFADEGVELQSFAFGSGSNDPPPDRMMHQDPNDSLISATATSPPSREDHASRGASTTGLDLRM